MNKVEKSTEQASGQQQNNEHHRFAHNAMAAVFEIFIACKDYEYARQAAYSAFEEIDRLEGELSRYIENSDISRINNLPANVPLQIGLDTYECLRHCSILYRETNQAFDITIGPLLDRWRESEKTGGPPSSEELRTIQQRIGFSILELKKSPPTVRLKTSPVRIDLGGFGKGYALDQAAALLREWNIHSAVLHGGRSTILALNSPPGKKGWPISIRNPFSNKLMAHLDLTNRSLSMSGLRKGRHIIDPRTARPVEGHRSAWSTAPAAAQADALSTAFMIMTPDEIKNFCERRPDTGACVLYEEMKKEKILRCGRWDRDIQANIGE